MKTSENTRFKRASEALPRIKYKFKTKLDFSALNLSANESHESIETHRLMRICDIVGENGILPISKSTFFANVKLGIYPKGTKISRRCTAWREADILRIAKRGFQ